MLIVKISFPPALWFLSQNQRKNRFTPYIAQQGIKYITCRNLSQLKQFQDTRFKWENSIKIQIAWINDDINNKLNWKPHYMRRNVEFKKKTEIFSWNVLQVKIRLSQQHHAMRQSMGKTWDTIALSSKVVSGNSLRIVIRANKWTATSGCAKIILDLFVTKKPTSHTHGWLPKEGYIYTSK